MDQVEEMCRSVFLINKGKGVLSGEVREIKQRFADNSVFLETDRDVSAHPAIARSEPKGAAVRVWLKDGEPPEKFLAGLLADGAKVFRYERALPSMDDVFVKVVTSS
jgi:ABC-2 type transport system ATP-binding protein